MILRLTLALVLASPLPGQCLGARAMVEPLELAIPDVEGWKDPSSLVHRIHNPGALVFAGQAGATRDRSGYASFRTDRDGFDALHANLMLKICARGWSLERIAATWSDTPRAWLSAIRRELFRIGFPTVDADYWDRASRTR